MFWIGLGREETNVGGFGKVLGDQMATGYASTTIMAILGRDPDVLREAIAEYLSAIGWNRLPGKERGGGQTLLEHSLATYDILLACLPFVAKDSFPPLKPEEAVAALLAAVVHDAGKSAPDFQAYLRGEGPPAEHVDPEAIRNVATGAAKAAGLPLNSWIEDVISSAILHDRRMRSNQGEISEWSRTHVSLRWRKLADFVNLADSVASAEDVIAAEEILRRSPALTGRAAVAAYQVQVRGVSTTFLHDAAIAAFDSLGWTPVVFCPDGSVFIGKGVPIPSRDDIARHLKARLETLLEERRDQLPVLAVGDPGSDFLPNPEYVREDNVEQLLAAAAGKRRPKERLKEEEIKKYREQWEKEEDVEPTDVDLEAIRTGGPERCMFKMFKYVTQKVVDEKAKNRAQELYDEWLGSGTFEQVISQSTDMPVKDHIHCVRRWHQLPVDDSATGLAVGDLDPSVREQRLRRKLAEIFREAFEEQRGPLPSDEVVNKWVERCLVDLALEAAPPAREEVEDALKGYASLKVKSHPSSKPPLQCAHCAAFILPEDEDKPSDALGTAGTFSNRRLAFAPPGSPPVCRRCTTDLKIGQVVLGRRVDTVIAVVPRRILGPTAGRELMHRVRELRDDVDRQLSPATADLSKYLALSLPAQVLEATFRGDGLRGGTLRPLSEKSRVKRLKELEKALQERLGDGGLAGLNADYNTKFDSVGALVEAILRGEAPEAVRRDHDVAVAVRSVMHEVQVGFGAVTPNLVVVSLDRRLGGKDDSDADRALYGFGLATLFALELGMATLIAPVSELRTALATRAGRAVYVPADGPVRRLLGGDWMTLDAARRWLRALQAAVILQERAKSNSLFEMLNYPSVGFLIRRIEQQAKKSAKTWWPDVWDSIEALKEVIG